MHTLAGIATLALAALPQVPAPASIAVPLTPAPAEARLPWSPKGASVPLVLADGRLAGSFALGHAATPPVALRLEKSGGTAHFDELLLDVDRDGELEESERLRTTPKEQRGKWWSSFEASIAIPLPEGQGTRAYPLSLWFVEDPAEPEAKPALRWSRRGFVEGRFELGSKPAFVVVTEMQMDGVFDQRDAWGLGRSAEEARKSSSRSLEGHAWLDGRAYRLSALDADGQRIAFESFDPGFTEAQERERLDTKAVDRAAARAEAPLAFEKDFAAALLRAQLEKKRLFVDFQTTWCGPCREMERWVYTAKDVVEAAAQVIPVMLDGYEQRELVRRYEVGGYPTLLLLDEQGKVLARATGYRSIAETVAFLRESTVARGTAEQKK
ncbi:MAG: thioredoxin family protein [Planctomycetes bacterium]|nr:thioredoxin family protein [Planctomycetota bacterium]